MKDKIRLHFIHPDTDELHEKFIEIEKDETLANCVGLGMPELKAFYLEIVGKPLPEAPVNLRVIKGNKKSIDEFFKNEKIHS